MASIEGTSGNDTLVGSGDVQDTISGLAGDDRIDGGTGFNFMIGGGGNDTITGGTRADTRPDFNDLNVASYKGSSKGVTATLGVQGQNAVVGVVTGQGRDVLVRVDSVVLSEFDDVFQVTSLWAGGQYDAPDLEALINSKLLVRYEGKHNEVRGSPGNDTLDGNGFTRIRYTDGKVDQAAGVQVTFTSEQGGYAKGFSSQGVAFTDTFTGVARARGTTGPDLLLGTAGTQWLDATPGPDTLIGDAGVDFVDFQPSAGLGVVVNLSLSTPQKVNDYFGEVTLLGIEGVRGSLYSDYITGNDQDNFIAPQEGDDTIDGGAGYDVVFLYDSKENFAITTNSTTGAVTLKDTRAPSSEANEWRYGTNVLTNVELILFEDGKVELDSSSSSGSTGSSTTGTSAGATTGGATGSTNGSTTTPSTAQTTSLTLIVDLLGQIFLLKDLTETRTAESHVVTYQGTNFNFSEIDPVVTTVLRNGEFTEEFAQEIADAYPTAAGISYAAVVGIVGSDSIDAVLLAVAGADGSYVG